MFKSPNDRQEIRIFDTDTVWVEVTVIKYPEDEVMNLTGATVTAKMVGDYDVSLTTNITDEPGGVVAVRIPNTDTRPGKFSLRVSVEKGTDKQVVVDADIIVSDSNKISYIQ